MKKIITTTITILKDQDYNKYKFNPLGCVYSLKGFFVSILFVQIICHFIYAMDYLL